jgi:hypothetical protein
MRRRGFIVAVTAASIALALAPVLAGCSQVAAIAPVGGDRLAEVRYAGIDVLTKAGIEILTAPVCEQSADQAVTCEGSDVDGQAIRVVSKSDAQDLVTVTVGSRSIYDGAIHAVLDEAMQP